MSLMVNVVALLKSALDVPVYTGQIPESQSGPAVAVQNVANPFQGRDVEGVKHGKSSVWRITVVAAMQSDVELIVDQLDDLDNTSNENFQRIFTELVNSEIGLNEEPYRRSFVDMTVY